MSRLIRAAYVAAYAGMRGWWFVRRPRTRGALICVHRGCEVLLIRNAYRRHYTFPGGYVGRRETPLAAACRELREEVAITLPATALRPSGTVEQRFEYRQERLYFYDAEVGADVAPRIDGREVVWAAFLPYPEALALNLFEPVRRHLEARDGRG